MDVVSDLAFYTTAYRDTPEDAGEPCLYELDLVIQHNKDPLPPDHQESQPDGDSGYGSNGTVETTVSQGEADVETKIHAPIPRVPRQPIPFPLPSIDDIYIIDKPMTADVRNRWQDIHENLSYGLAADLRESNFSHKQASMRLMMLGKSEHDAKPAVVVFCCESQWKRVKRFFEQKAVKELYQPQQADLPSFDLHLGPPPKPRGYYQKGPIQIFASESAFRNWFLSPPVTLCGMPIKLKEFPSGRSGMATLGGVIKVTDKDDNVRCYGMTAGHIISSILQPMLQPGPFTDQARLTCIPDRPRPHPTPLNLPPRASWVFEPHVSCGFIIDQCLQQCASEDERYYDWALCELSGCLEPNYFRTAGNSAGPYPELDSPYSDMFNTTDDISVVVMTGSGGHKKGWMSTLPSPVMLGPGSEFVTTYTITFASNSTICDGDSGSWVVNESTLEVIGHVIATDELGGAYVVPLMDTFRDIRERLDAKSVKLASASDIRSVGAVMTSLIRIGAPQLDAIRGNGGIVRSEDYCDTLDSLPVRDTNASDSGYGSNGFSTVKAPDLYGILGPFSHEPSPEPRD